MKPPTLPLLLRLGLLLLICAFGVVREITPLPALSPIIGMVFLVWFALAWRNLAYIGKLTAAIALGLATFVWWRGDFSSDLLARAIGRAAFFTWFLLAMDILRSAAMRSAMVLRSGQALVNQPPGRRYTMLTLGSHVLSMLLNMGALTLLGTMTRRSIEQQTKADTIQRSEIRLRRMTLGTARGFAAFTLWMPTSVTILVVLAAIPGLEWQEFALQGMATAATFMTLGWLIDRISHPAPKAQFDPAGSLAQAILALVPMTLLTFAILGVGVVLAQLSGLRLIAALLISLPSFGLGWVLVQYQRTDPAMALRLAARRIWRQVLPELTTLHNEIAILAAAGFISVLLPQQIDTAALGQLIAHTGMSTGLVLALLVWLVALGSIIGLNPIISVAVGLELLVRIPNFDASPRMLAMAGTTGWALTTGLSPLGASIRLTARCIGRSPVEIGLIWNRRFSLVAGCVVSAVLVLFA